MPDLDPAAVEAAKQAFELALPSPRGVALEAGITAYLARAAQPSPEPPPGKYVSLDSESVTTAMVEAAMRSLADYRSLVGVAGWAPEALIIESVPTAVRDAIQAALDAR